MAEYLILREEWPEFRVASIIDEHVTIIARRWFRGVTLNEFIRVEKRETTLITAHALISPLVTQEF